MIYTFVQRLLSCPIVNHLKLFIIITTSIFYATACHKNLGFQANTDKKNKLTINTNEQRDVSEKSILSNGEKCYQDLCGGNDNSIDFKYIINFAKQGNAESHQAFEHDILNDLQKYMDLNLTLQTYQQKTLIDFDPTKSKLKFSEAQILFFIFIEYYVHKGEFLQKNLINTERVKKFTELMEQTEFLKTQKIYRQDPERFYLEFYKKDSLNEAIKEEIKFSQMLNTKAKQEFKELFNESTELFNELLSQKEKKPTLLKQAMKKSTTIHLFYEFVYGNLIGKNFKQLTDLDKIIADRIEKLKQTKFDNQNSILKKIDQCHSTWNSNYNLHPTDQQILALKTKAQEVMSGMKSFLILKYPELSNTMAEIQFQFPENKEQMKAKWLDTLTKKSILLENYKKSFQNLSIENKLIFSILILSDLNQFNCDDLFQMDPMDQFNTREKVVTLSWVPAIYPQFSTSLISHEVAHYIFDYVDSLHEEKMCLASKKGNDKYLEEDFADAIASIYLQSLNENKDQEFYACALASMDEKQSLINKDFYDQHSTNLSRALQNQIQGGKDVPDSCLELIKEEKIKNTDKTCF